MLNKGEKFFLEFKQGEGGEQIAKKRWGATSSLVPVHRFVLSVMAFHKRLTDFDTWRRPEDACCAENFATVDVLLVTTVAPRETILIIETAAAATNEQPESTFFFISRKEAIAGRSAKTTIAVEVGSHTLLWHHVTVFLPL